jgi:hypothetical protein
MARTGGFGERKCSASSPAVMGFVRSKCRICRRVGSESALKTWFMVRNFAKYRMMSSANWKCASQLILRFHESARERVRADK